MYRNGIRVNAISPGPTETPMFLSCPADFIKEHIDKIPMKRMAQPKGTKFFKPKYHRKFKVKIRKKPSSLIHNIG